VLLSQDIGLMLIPVEKSEDFCEKVSAQKVNGF
jgi:hypothetical protein